MVQSVRSALDYYTTQFGPYPYKHLTIVEVRGNEIGMHADPTLVRYSEETGLLTPRSNEVDLPLSILSHELGHQWWGHQLQAAFVEGAPILSESLAQYSAMGVMEKAKGRQHLYRLMTFMRQPFPYAPIHHGEPLMRGIDPYLAYRKGPFALQTMSEYIGRDKVEGTLRRLLEKHRPGTVPLATTLDLYSELQSVTPDSLQHVLHDLFEVNTFWEFRTDRVSAKKIEDGSWNVAIEVRSRKMVADSAGVEKELPIDEWVEISVFGQGRLNDPIYSRKHRIYQNEQTITINVPKQPAFAGIDPYHILDWVENEDDNNVKPAKIE
jgi:hypothetical protein